jgi:hypothetical protein
MDQEQVAVYPTPNLKWVITNVKAEEPFKKLSVKKLHQLFVSQDGAIKQWIEIPTEEVEQEEK